MDHKREKEVLRKKQVWPDTCGRTADKRHPGLGGHEERQGDGEGGGLIEINCV